MLVDHLYYAWTERRLTKVQKKCRPQKNEMPFEISGVLGLK